MSDDDIGYIAEHVLLTVEARATRRNDAASVCTDRHSQTHPRRARRNYWYRHHGYDGRSSNIVVVLCTVIQDM